MKDEDIRFNRRLSLLIFGSVIFFSLMMALRIGLDNTPYEATDSAGRTMGFNDPLGAEHYAIMLKNFSFSDLLKTKYVYEWALLAVHGAGACLLLWGSCATARLTRWFFAIQPFLFPLGVPALLIFPLLMIGLITCTSDREGFVDIPFLVVTTQPMWIVISMVIMFAMKGPGLGIAQMWEVLSRLQRTALQKFASAVR